MQRSKSLSLDVSLGFGKQGLDVGVFRAIGINELPRTERSLHMSLPPSRAKRFAGKVFRSTSPLREELPIKEYPYPAVSTYETAGEIIRCFKLIQSLSPLRTRYAPVIHQLQ